MRYEEIVNEIETGVSLEPEDFLDKLHKKDFGGKQLDLFREIPSMEPDVPAHYKIVGRMGPLFVAKRGKVPGEEANEYQHYVWFDSNSAVSYVSMHTYDRNKTNYPQYAPHAPDLNGVGLRVHAVQVQPKFRGQNLGLKMYHWILSNVCDYIMADDSQTPDGVALWKRLLATADQFSVEVWDGDKYESRYRKRGRDFAYVYDKCHLIPWVCLPEKREYVLYGEQGGID